MGFLKDKINMICEAVKKFVLVILPCFCKKYIPKFFKEILPKFLKDNFEVTSTKLSKRVGTIIAAILVLIVVIDHKQYTIQTFDEKWILLAFCLVFPLVIGALISFTIKIKNEWIHKIWHFCVLFLMPIVSISMTECLNNIYIYDMTYRGFYGNYLLILLLHFLVYAISGSLKWAILIVNPILYGFALAHCYVMEFRGTPFIPMDFFSIKTAANVANTYEFKLLYTVLTATLIFIFIIVVAIKLKKPNFHPITKVVSRTFMGTFFTVLISLFYFTSIFADMGIKPDFWNQNRGYKNYGFAWNFFCNTKYLFMSTPTDYDPDQISGFVENTVDEDEDTQVEVTENTPNIICIMNETWSDLSVLGDFTTNEPYMPYINSLTENVVKGNLYVPVIGAGTSNTEFEFLTGHSTAFLPSGSNAYMLYIKNPIASIASTLEAQGYSSLAFHPYYKSGWNRVNVYNYMGYNRHMFLEDIMDISIMNDYMQNGNDPDYLQSLITERYPENPNMILRQYISDSYNYDVLIDEFENRDKSSPFFAFNVTMQNHGGYTTSSSNFNESIYVTSSEKVYPKANRYLSLIKETDNAFKKMVDYFSNVKEPTVICMFGDHQPSIETAFIAELLGVRDLSTLTPEQEQKRHLTPFIIWANYDIDEKFIDKLSVNYLSSYLLDIAGVELTDYNKYLIKLSEQLPVIDTVGYIDAENNYYKWSQSSPYQQTLSEYERIQYNGIFDVDNKKNNVFLIDGYEHKATEPEEDKEKSLEETE